MLGAGCGAPAPTASVNGTVTDDDGKPFSGKIVFMAGGTATEQKMVEAAIEGGQYTVPVIAPGTKNINVFKARPAGSNRQDGFWVAKPRTVEIRPGSQTIDFEMTRVAP
jgi:hypothetical protein